MIVLKRVSVLASLLVAAHCAAAFAQLSTASVNGTVRDATGSVVPEAAVVLRNVDTSVERRSLSNAAGVYVFLNITPGNYSLDASKPGFRTGRVNPFALQVNQTATFDFTLDVGAVEQTIEVQAVGAEVQSSTSELGAVVTRQQVVDLPLNGRNFTQLLALTPGVSPISVSQNNGGSFTASAIGTYTFPSINGQTNRSNFWTLDGISNQEPFNSTYAIPPIVDTIQEFKVNSHNDQAEFGGVLGGVVNVATKSGTNDLHGSAWEYVRNNAFDARPYFLQQVQVFRWNQFGAAGGGPVVLPKLYNGRNRTFFYLGYQGYRLRRPSNSFFRVPIDQNYQGDFSDWPRQIFNPFSTRPDPANPGKYIRDPFPGNRVPQNLMDPRMVAFAKATLPSATNVGLPPFNALDTTPFERNQEEYTGRVDQNLGTKDFAFFRYSGLLINDTQSGGRPALVNLGERRAKNFGINWVHTFSPSSTLQVQFGHSRTRQDSFQRFRNPGFAKDAGFSDQFAGGFIGNVTIVPSFGIAQYFSGGESDSLNIPVSVYQYSASYSKIVGGHTLKAGGEWSTNNFESIYRNANSSFDTPQTADLNNLTTTGSPLASYFLNVPDSAGRRNVHETLRPGGVMAFYFQDQWKLSPRFTINLGLRYDRTFQPPYGQDSTIGQNGGIETGAVDLLRGVYLIQKLPPTCAERGHAPCLPSATLPDHVQVEPRGKIYHDTPLNFQPRIGIAYRLSQKTAIRSAFGIAFDNWAAVTQTAQNYEGAWPDAGQQLANNLNYPTTAQTGPVVQGQKPFLQGLLPEATPFNQVQWFMDPNAKNPYSLQWNFGVQHQINEAMVVSANYVGSGSRRLDVGGYYNVALKPGPGNPRDRAPFPYIAPTYYDRSWGKSSYNAFQFELTKRFSHGLLYTVSYTWSKSLDYGCSGWYGVEGCSTQDPYNLKGDRSVSGFDIPHYLAINWLYELPIGTGKAMHTGSRGVDYIVGGWQFNGIATFRSGQPYTANISGDIGNTGNISGYIRPNLVGDPTPSNRTTDNWLNKSAFAAPPQFTFGSLGRYALRTDWFKNFDLSMFRIFSIREQKAIEFRAEAFNAFNNVTFAAPTANLTNVNFGRVLSTASSPRQLQLGLKLLF